MKQLFKARWPTFGLVFIATWLLLIYPNIP